jgi:acyl-CoA dehydrogenase family member 9
MDEEQRRLAEELLFAGKKAPSFGKQLYFGVFDPNNIFPYPQVSEEEEKNTSEFLKKVKALAENEIDPDWIDRNASIPDSLIASLGKLGILGVTIPQEYGGLGMSQYAYCKAVEIISARCGSTALFINAHQSVGLKALLLFGTPEQKGRWLPPLARGEQLAAFSLTEPNAGSDASGIETRAVFDPEHNVYHINGVKQWTTNGAIAQVLTVMAKMEIDTPQGKQDKITAFLVTPDMPGFEVLNPALEKVGMRGSKTANLAYRNVEVPAANILGPIGGGLRVCLTVLDYGRTTFGAMCTGAAKVCLERAIEHARTRYQFKRPLASFGLVKQKIANMSALTYAMEATTYLTAGLVDANVEDIMLESAMLKVFCSDSLWSFIYDTMQIFGGRSFFTDQPFERMMRDARLNMIGEGSNEVMRAFIGAVGMRDVGMEMKGVLDALSNPFAEGDKLWSFAKRIFHRRKASRVPVRSSLLKDEARQLQSAVRRFGIAIMRVLAKYREDVVEHQLDLDRIATSAMAIYTTTAVLSKLDSALAVAKEPSEALNKELAVGKLYCQQAMGRLDVSLSNLFNPEDAQIDKVSDLLSGIHP